MFDATHELVFRLVGEGKVAGLRIDHPDGLYAPGEYFRRLQEGALLATARRLLPELARADVEALGALYRARPPSQPAAPDARPLWIVAEKILEPGRAPARLVAGGGHHRLRLPGLRQRALRGRGTSRQMTALYTRASPGAGGLLADHDLRGQAADHAGLDGERDQPARPSPRSASRSATASPATSPSTAWRARSARSSPPSPSTAPTWATTARDPSARDRAYIERGGGARPSAATPP